MSLAPLPDRWAAQRAEAQRVAVHVLARARAQAVGRFGLVVAPGGIATPAFGPDATVVRLSPTSLVVERAGEATHLPLAGASLRSLAAAAGADLDADLAVGRDTPPPGEVDLPLALEPAAIATLGVWFQVGWTALDIVVAARGGEGRPARTQLWPEHFDVGTSLATDDEDARANLGASAGDDYHSEPYLYIGPWGPERPGDPAFWNAPFGAVLGFDDLRGAEDPLLEAVRFLEEGLAHLGSAAGR